MDLRDPTTDPWGPSRKQQEPGYVKSSGLIFQHKDEKSATKYTSKMPFDHPAYASLKNAALGQNSGTVFTHPGRPLTAQPPSSPLQPVYRQGTTEDSAQAGLRRREAWVLPA